MSQENVEIVRRAFEAFNKDGVEAVVSSGLYSPKIVFDLSTSGIPGLGVYRGYQEVKSFFEDDWFQTFPFEEWEQELDELIDHGDQVIGMSRQRGRGKSSGVDAELQIAQIATLRDGQIARVDTYLDRDQALEAAGLSE
jgi:ketosteroid isomerase-like protein